MAEQRINSGKNNIKFPAEITFKSIFYTKPFLTDTISSIINDYEEKSTVSYVESRNGKFLSITITAFFNSNENLQNLCDKISSVDGFFMMF